MREGWRGGGGKEGGGVERGGEVREVWCQCVEDMDVSITWGLDQEPVTVRNRVALS